MDAINTFFTDLGSKMPFATDFFSSKLAIGGTEVSAFFLVCIAAIVALIALIVIIACAATVAKAKRKIAGRAPAKDEKTTAKSEPQPDVLKEVKDESLDEDEYDIVPSVKPLSADEHPAEEAKEATKEENAQEEAQPAEETEAKPVETEPVAEEEVAEEEQPAEETEQPEVKEEAPVEPVEEPKAEELEAQEAQAVEEPKPIEAREEAAIDDVDIAATAAKAPKQKENSDANVAEEVTQMKKEEVKQEPVKEEKSKKALVGTFEVALCLDGYRFYLYASNKQLMYESVGFTSSEGAIKGIDTFRKTLQECPYIITRDKYGRYRYVFNKRYQGENYTSAAAAQSAAESVKRWAENAKVIVRNPKPEAVEEYKKGLDALRTKDDVDWDAVVKEEKEAKPMGKFTVEEDGNQDEVIGYRFYLIANNAQILYTSAIYTSASGALKAIDTFKRAVYVGNFYVDEDKFGHFRYILRANATTTYVGESYKTRSSAESSIESVKKFVKCATVIPFKKGGDEA